MFGMNDFLNRGLNRDLNIDSDDEDLEFEVIHEIHEIHENEYLNQDLNQHLENFNPIFLDIIDNNFNQIDQEREFDVWFVPQEDHSRWDDDDDQDEFIILDQDNEFILDQSDDEGYFSDED